MGSVVGQIESARQRKTLVPGINQSFASRSKQTCDFVRCAGFGGELADTQ